MGGWEFREANWEAAGPRRLSEGEAGGEEGLGAGCDGGQGIHIEEIRLGCEVGKRFGVMGRRNSKGIEVGGVFRRGLGRGIGEG